MTKAFHTDYASIKQQVENLNPIAYGKTRNYVHGAVTRLGPYLSRGVISTRQVWQSVLKRGYKPYEIEVFLKELAWRDYFQLLFEAKPKDFDFSDAEGNGEIPEAILLAGTGIQAIDLAIGELEQTGYMHNHCRMYTASLICNVTQTHWLAPAKWMYYHLLDGDWASNAGSWNCVAGSHGRKKYYANQENINRYTGSSQERTFLDIDYESLEHIPIPEGLKRKAVVRLQTILPKTENPVIDQSLPTMVYTYYNLDPEWRKAESANRVLLLEPDLFSALPISSKCLDFALKLAENICQIQLFVGSFEDLKRAAGDSTMIYKQHPLQSHFIGIEDARDWIYPSIKGEFQSFFAFWRKVEKEVQKETGYENR